MGKLWEKNYSLDRLVEQFNAGDNALLDHGLVNADCAASLAHARMLASIKILKQSELKALEEGLRTIIKLNEKGHFPIQAEDEDCHTAIENHLTAQLGEAGKKIHTGRSRNDQVIAALRLYSRSFLFSFYRAGCELAGLLLELALKHAEVPMPGRTHMQIAMPSSVGLWAGSYAEELLDDLALVKGAYDLNDACPLGSAASYGVPLPLDREMTSELLAFKEVQNNVLYANNSRGKMESIILDAAAQVMLTLSKTAQDLILFSMPEFGYFSLPPEICTGSSIMPQKRNPDVLELIRARAATVCACGSQVKELIRALPGGYNGDFQETKGPFMRGISLSLASVRIMSLVIEKLEVHPERLAAGFIPEIFATDKALELAAEGMPFRDAYRQVGSRLEQLKGADPLEAIRRKKHTGAPGNLRLDKAEARLKERRGAFEAEEERVGRKMKELIGFEASLYR